MRWASSSTPPPVTGRFAHCRSTRIVSQYHMIRYGALGQVGLFVAADAVCYPRRTEVVCRTPRGLEIGQVLTRCLPDGAATDGAVLRQVTLADRLLLARLEQHRHQAFTACQELLQRRDLPAVLVDVEALFDGQSLLFYFLGEITPELEAVTSQLAETFDTKVQLRRFAKSLAEGCGPGCGTESADGCGSTGCSTCAVAKACQSRN